MLLSSQPVSLSTQPKLERISIRQVQKELLYRHRPRERAPTRLVLGVNDDKLKDGVTEVVSNASCTTNCIAPVMAVLENNFGVEKAMMTTSA